MLAFPTRRLARAASVLLVLAVSLPGCAFFSGKPPLPNQASIEQLGRGASPADFAAAVQNADVIYFPEDRIASAGRSDPAALLLEAFGQSGLPFAIGWGSIVATEQGALDALATKGAAAGHALIAHLDVAGSGRAREHCRATLRETAALRHLALRCPAGLLAKWGAAARLAPEEEPLIPHGFASPAGGLAEFPARAGTAGENARSLTSDYRTELLRLQFAAEIIVRHLREANGAKLLVFADEADLAAGRGLPFYVAQKLPVRQLVFGPDAPGSARMRLLSGRGRKNGRAGFQIVDRAPRARRD